MRYVDTGSRDPKHALGTWLTEVLMGDASVVAVRVQTGYFGADALGYCESALQVLAKSDGHTRLLVGSNEGQTPRATIADLLKIAGAPRSGLRVGVVSFQSGLFHPKVFHFQRGDGSSTAYVGSANLTVPGASGQNVEAAMILDSKQGDPQSVLTEIADAVDAWFIEQRSGMYPVSLDADLDPLVAAGVLGVPAAPRTPRNLQPAKGGGQQQQPGHSLKQLVAMPPIQTPLTPKPAPSPVTGGQAPGGSSPGHAIATTSGSSTTTQAQLTVVKRWYKLLHRSDVSRLGAGSNPQGAITLTQGPRMKGHAQHPINHETYFRSEFFADGQWVLQPDGTREVAAVTVDIVIYGESRGSYELQVRYSAGLVSEQGNRTALLHWGPELSEYLRRERNHDGDVVTIEKLSDGNYRLTIAAQETGQFIA